MMPLSDRISPAARQTIKAAFDDLQKAISTQDRASLEGTTLEDVRQAAISVEGQLVARQCMRNMRRLTPLFDGLGHYSKSIEVLCNGTPYLPWIWAPIKLILKVSSDYIEAFEKIMKAYSRIASSLSRFKLFQQTFSNNPLMQDTLAIFYVDILNFHKEAYTFVRRSGWKILFMTSWGRFERRFDGIIEDLSKHEELIDKTANAVNIYSANAMREDLKAWRQQELLRLSEKEQEGARDQYSRIAGFFKADENDQIHIFDSIMSKATGDSKHSWILAQTKVQAWMRTTGDTAFLLLHGHPGTGKSVLATQIATFLRSSGQTQVITHFSSYSSSLSIDYLSVLKSIVLQLIQPHPDLIIYTFDQLILNNNKPTASFLEKFIGNIIEGGSSIPSQKKCVHLIFDGLDECESNVQKRIMSLLERIVSTAASLSSNTITCKVMVFSRFNNENPRKIKQRDLVSLSDENENINAAILTYSSDRLEAMRSQLFAFRMSSDDLRTLANNIMRKADGMFLWAKLVLDYIGSNLFFKQHEIISAADYFPTELSRFYDKIFAQLTARFDQKSVQRLKCILGWIAFAKRPLRTGEFLSALSFSSGDPSEDELPPAHIFDICAPLIEYRQKAFTFVHVSVKDYLQNQASHIFLNEIECSSEQALAVATCLLSSIKIFHTDYPKSSRFERVTRGLHGLHIYATEHWVDYLLDLACLVDLSQSLFFHHSHEIALAMKDWAINVNKTSKYGDTFRENQEASNLIHQLSPVLYDVLRATLISKESDGEPQNEHDGDETSLRSLLVQYQQIIKELLSKPSLPQVSFQDLERFKQEFGPMAFTCRVWSCPYASTGFDTDVKRDEHEASHTKILCREPGCQYPAFHSLSALNRHRLKYHDPQSKLRGRRRIKLKNVQTMGRRHRLEENSQYPSSFSVPEETKSTPVFGRPTVSVYPASPSEFDKFQDSPGPGSEIDNLENLIPRSSSPLSPDLLNTTIEIEHTGDPFMVDAEEFEPEMSHHYPVPYLSDDDGKPISYLSDDDGEFPSGDFIFPMIDGVDMDGANQDWLLAATANTTLPNKEDDTAQPSVASVPSYTIENANEDPNQSEPNVAPHGHPTMSFDHGWPSKISSEDALVHLKTIGQGAVWFHSEQIRVNIHMSVEEYNKTCAHLKLLVVDMSKLGISLLKWYRYTQDKTRARKFFDARLRVVQQFADGEKMTIVKPCLNIRIAEIDASKMLFETMTKDLLMIFRIDESNINRL